MKSKMNAKEKHLANIKHNHSADKHRQEVREEVLNQLFATKARNTKEKATHRMRIMNTMAGHFVVGMHGFF